MTRLDALGVDSAEVIEALRGKWVFQVLCAMLDHPVRLSQLRRMIPGASKKALTSHLRNLERLHFVRRRDLSSTVLHVEYVIDGSVKEPLRKLIESLIELQEHLSQLDDHRILHH